MPTTSSSSSRPKDDESEQLLRASLKNHFKILSLQQISFEAEHALEYFSDRLQNTRALLADSEARILLQEEKEKERTAAAASEVDANDNTSSRSVSPQVAEKNNEEKESLKRRLEDLQDSQMKLRERNSYLSRKSRSMQSELNDTVNHVKRLTEVISDSRKTMEMMVGRRKDDDDDSNNGKKAPSSTTSSYSSSTADIMRNFVRELEGLITNAYVTSAATSLAVVHQEQDKHIENHNDVSQSSNNNNYKQEEGIIIEKQIAAEKLALTSEKAETKLEIEKSVLFNMLRKSQKEAAYYRSKYEEAAQERRAARSVSTAGHQGDQEDDCHDNSPSPYSQHKHFPFNDNNENASPQHHYNNNHSQNNHNASSRSVSSSSSYLPASPRMPYSSSYNETKQALEDKEFKIKQLQHQNENLTQQRDQWKEEAGEFQERLMECERDLVKYKMEAEAYKSLVEQGEH